MTLEVERVLLQVARRQGLRSLGRSTFLWTIVFGGVYAVFLIGSRLLGLLPDLLGTEQGYGTWSIAAVPLLGLGVGWFTHRRSDLATAARAADLHLDTDDLFLTSLEAQRAAGQYQALVEASARARAGKVYAVEVAPLPFGRRLAQTVLVLGTLWSASAYLPACDPFGDAKERAELGQQRQELVVAQQKSEQRKKALQSKPLDEENSAEVSRALQEVVKSFRKMDRKKRSTNTRILKRSQQAVHAKWREARGKSQQGGVSSPRLQSLGRSGDPRRVASWRKDLSRGRVDSLRRELSELREALQKIAASKDAAEAEKLRQEIRERTKNLADFLKNNASSRELNETLSRALDQLRAMAIPNLAEEARRALDQTLELSALELKNLAQSLRDMKSLEQALNALQVARQANSKGCCDKGDGQGGGKGGKGGEDGSESGKPGDSEEPGLDGDMTPGLQAMLEYEEYYRKLLEEQGELDEPGPGMGGPGRGAGGTAPENNDQTNQFKTEKSLSALRAGKILMTLKTKEVGDKGKVEEEYTERLEQVKQGVGEAILQERVPPGYHKAIRKYFDNIGDDDKSKQTGTPKTSPPKKSPPKKK